MHSQVPVHMHMMRLTDTDDMNVVLARFSFSTFVKAFKNFYHFC